MATLDQFQGCMLGLSLGDALGAPFEGGVLERLLWRAIGVTRNGEMRWTDDTQMSIDLVESFLAQGRIDPDDLAIRFAQSYRWSRGYGPAAAKILKRIRGGSDWRIASRSIYRDGSYGNGAAMRAPILGVIFENRPDELASAARLTGAVTHAHPLALEGALLLAAATEHAVHGHDRREIILNALTYCQMPEFRSRLKIALEWLEADEQASAQLVKRHLGCGVAAQQSCVTAVYIALRFRTQPFLTMLDFVRRLGGDVDTVGAMSGAIWGASNGHSKLPADALEKLEQREYLEQLARRLHQHVSSMQSKQQQ